MQSSVTKPSSSAVRVVIGGMTMRFLISTGPIQAGVRRMFIYSGRGASGIVFSSDGADVKRDGAQRRNKIKHQESFERHAGRPGKKRRHPRGRPQETCEEY